jgi:ATP adenylyltransferase/5',5'''-P-1,P-4-tetraphosphate phosphorylase II
LGIFNCGFEAGSSIGHKHMQVLPKAEVELFPDSAAADQRGGMCLMTSSSFPDASAKHSPGIVADPDVPYKHAIWYLPTSASTQSIFSAYATARILLGVTDGAAHNVVLTKDWIIVIPRSKAGVGKIIANAYAMMGVVWANSDAQMEEWKSYGPVEVLREIGMPK